MITRRTFIQRGAQVGLIGATASLFNHSVSAKAFAQMTSAPYKAIVVVRMTGGNDSNNMLVPLDDANYAGYANIRGGLALPQQSLLPLRGTSSTQNYGLHPALPNVAALYAAKKALFVANIGPMVQPATKAQLLANSEQYPDSLFSHPQGIAEWESSGASAYPSTGWGGRIADLIASQSGTLPPVLNAGLSSVFTVGSSVQSVSVQGGGVFSALPADLDSAVLRIAQSDCSSPNVLVAQAAQLRAASMQQQSLIDSAASYRTLQTTFPNTSFGRSMQKIAQVIGGHSTIGASRQIFYAQQGAYDTHEGQLSTHQYFLQELDGALGAFMTALDEMGLTNQVLVCTHSDFNRTCAPNTAAGSDHAWGSHQLVLGGGLPGGQVLGTMPTFELNGPDDLNGLGIWVPTTAVSQLTSGMGAWMGLSQSQLASVFPDLAKFPGGSLKFS